MQVIATQLGYYEHMRRKIGAEFTLLDPKHFSERWMKVVGTPPSAIETSPLAEDDADEEGRRFSHPKATFSTEPSTIGRGACGKIKASPADKKGA